MDFTKIKKLTIGGVELKQLFVGGIQVWKSGYKNWVKYSTEADGVTIYGLDYDGDGKNDGYKDGYRVRSGGAEGAHGSGTCTGFIPVKGGDIVRVSSTGEHVPFASGGAGTAINVSRGVSGTPGDNIGQVSANYYPGGYGIFDGAYYAYGAQTVVQKENYWQWTVPPTDSGVAFIRVSAITNRDEDKVFNELIVTVNEEIE